jgi:hypothetical protein
MHDDDRGRLSPALGQDFAGNANEQRKDNPDFQHAGWVQIMYGGHPKYLSQFYRLLMHFKFWVLLCEIMHRPVIWEKNYRIIEFVGAETDPTGDND